MTKNGIALGVDKAGKVIKSVAIGVGNVVNSVVPRSIKKGTQRLSKTARFFLTASKKHRKSRKNRKSRKKYN